MSRRMLFTSAGFAALLSAALVFRAVGDAGPPATPILVAARDIAAGARLAAADIAIRRWPADALPEGAQRPDAAARLIGMVMPHGVPAFTPLRYAASRATASSASTMVRQIGYGSLVIPAGGSARGR